MVKSHKGLKRTKVFAFGYSVRNFEYFSKFTGRNPCWSHFFVKLLPEIAYEKRQRKVYPGNFIKKETLTQRLLYKYLPVNFENIMNTTLNTSARLPLK